MRAVWLPVRSWSCVPLYCFTAMAESIEAAPLLTSAHAAKLRLPHTAPCEACLPRPRVLAAQRLAD
jgi:hypothetical protein